MDFHSETLSQAQASIHKLQQNLINFLEKGVLTPINIKEFMNCYGLINGISGKIKGEDEEAAKKYERSAAFRRSGQDSSPAK